VRKLEANNPDNWKVINQQELLMLEAKAKALPDKSVRAVKENLQFNTSGNKFKDTTAGHSDQRRSNKLTKITYPNFQQMKDPCLSLNFISESQLFRTPGGYSMKHNFPSTKFSPSQSQILINRSVVSNMISNLTEMKSDLSQGVSRERRVNDGEVGGSEYGF
jgi:hypothetical protein